MAASLRLRLLGEVTYVAARCSSEIGVYGPLRWLWMPHNEHARGVLCVAGTPRRFSPSGRA